VARPQERPPAPDPLACLRQALACPIGSPTLSELVPQVAAARNDNQVSTLKVAILIDDATRCTPAHLILPLLLESLEQAGVLPAHISIVIALGTHRPMTPKEIITKVGPQLANHETSPYPLINDNSTHATSYMGTSQNGIPAHVQPAVANAHLKIGVGQILPHMNAGYSGGGKIVLPGVCSSVTVETFHAQEVQMTENLLGNLESPIRRDLEQFVEECVGLDFIVNVIMTADHQLYKCVAGHFIQAHRVGVQYAQEIYGVPVPRKYPIVVASAYPKDMDLWQATTAIAAGEIMLEQQQQQQGTTTTRSTLIVVAHAWDRHSAYPDFAHRMGQDPQELQAQFEADNIPQSSSKMTTIFGISMGRYRQKFQMALVSEGLTKQDADTMGFLYHETIEEAVEVARQRCGDPQAPVGILTHGGITLPLLGPVGEDPQD